MTKESFYISGNGYSTTRPSSIITTWEDITAQIIIDENRCFDIVGTGISYFKNIKYCFLFNTIKNSHNDYHLLKTLYKIKENNDITYLHTLEYKITKYSLSNLNFSLKLDSESFGIVEGNINFKRNDKFYKL